MEIAALHTMDSHIFGRDSLTPLGRYGTGFVRRSASIFQHMCKGIGDRAIRRIYQYHFHIIRHRKDKIAQRVIHGQRTIHPCKSIGEI